MRVIVRAALVLRSNGHLEHENLEGIRIDPPLWQSVPKTGTSLTERESSFF